MAMMCNYEFIFDTGISLVPLTATALTPTQALKQTHQQFLALRNTEPVDVYWVFNFSNGKKEIHKLGEFLPGRKRYNLRNREPNKNYVKIELRDSDWGIVLSNRVSSLPRQASA